MSNIKIMDMLQTVFIRFGSKAVNFIVFLLVARSLTGSEMGEYGLVFSTALILSVLFDFGLRNSSAVYVGGKFELAKKSSLMLHICWLIFSILGILFLISLPYFLESMKGIREYNLPFSILFSGMLYIRIMQGALLGVGNIGDFNRSELSSRAVLIVLTVFFYFSSGVTIENALWSLAVSQMIASLYLLMILIKRKFLVFTVEVDVLKRMLRRGVLFMIAVVVMSLSKRLTFYALGEYTSLDVSGVFFSILRMSEIVTEVALAVAVVLFSHSVRSKTEEAVIQSVAVTTRHMTAILFVMTLVMFSISSVVLNLLLPMVGIGGLAAFDVILWGTFFGSIWVMIFPSLASVVNPLVVACLFLPSVLFLSSAFYIYINFMGGVDLYTASQLYLISNFVTLVVFLGFARRRFQVSPISFLRINMAELFAIGGMFTGKLRGLLK